MITYEIAKQLKETGFPQKSVEYRDFLITVGDKPIDEHSAKEMGYEYAYVPTLSELIEACGRIGVKIGYMEDGRIYAEFDKDDGHGNLIDFCLPTLEEIYSNLWLELNK